MIKSIEEAIAHAASLGKVIEHEGGAIEFRRITFDEAQANLNEAKAYLMEQSKEDLVDYILGIDKSEKLW